MPGRTGYGAQIGRGFGRGRGVGAGSRCRRGMGRVFSGDTTEANEKELLIQEMEFLQKNLKHVNMQLEKLSKDEK